MQKVIFQDVGWLDYQKSWDYQTSLHKSLVDRKLKNRDQPVQEQEAVVHHVLFVEHPPVFTLGKSGSVEHLLLSEDELAARGIQYFPINRGGDITYHGPGQIVGYPILDLDLFFNDVHRYVRNLEEVIIRVLADFEIPATRVPGYTGVWIEEAPQRPIRPEEAAFFEKGRKICAIGVHLSRWVTLHGFAFNVNTDLSYFDLIVPCGIQEDDKTVTSMEKELGQAVEQSIVKQLLQKHFCAVFDCVPTHSPLESNRHFFD